MLSYKGDLSLVSSLRSGEVKDDDPCFRKGKSLTNTRYEPAGQDFGRGKINEKG